MKRLLPFTTIACLLACQSALAQMPTAPTTNPQPAPATRAASSRRATPPPIQANPEELSPIREKPSQLEAIVKELKAKPAAPELVTAVEGYAHAGRMLLEYPD